MVSFCATDHVREGEEGKAIERFICSHPTLYGDQLYPAFDLRLLHQYIEQQLGCAWAQRLLDAIGITATELSVRQFVLAWQVLKAMALASEWLPGSLAGFHFGATFRPEHLQGLQRPLAGCETLGQVYELVRSNPNLVGSFTDNIETLSARVMEVRSVNVSNIDTDTMTFLFQQGLSSMLSVARMLTNRPIPLLGVFMGCPGPNRAEHLALERALGCRIEFGADFFGWRLDTAILSYPITWHPSARGLASDEVADDETDSLINDILELLLPCNYGFPTLEQVAEALQLSSRTLRRRLSAIGTSYQKILNQVRCQLAIDRFQAGERCIDTIAEQLGFNETCNFRHAFKRWTGKAPGEFMTGLPVHRTTLS
ncbi:AraC family transcriptional regulator [Ferrimonas sp. SCSIO 43195]|uniref:AraC family transcriptional regulator n=1 Tax=Ferrimonas sp. SCSIO 43195 TaxID=2822844 RepID=UPI002075229F|nr:AraC family transcriptional regulator [Ferrimonas sp. SCSIO 43195]USD37642.1 helix-turn-helix domain-containing protein [Ferrimonas sp. SCSIO 43195]